jgi:hypothetical protein
MSNHSQTVDLGFEAQLRNPHFSSLRAWYKSHTASPDLSIVRPPSTRPVRPSPVLYTKSPTLTMILVAHAMPHLPLIHHETSKCDSPHETKDKGKTMNYPRFEFKHHQVNNSSQSNQRTDYLISHNPSKPTQGPRCTFRNFQQ